MKVFNLNDLKHCKECGCEEVVLERFNPFDNRYVCQNCGSNGIFLEDVVASIEDYLGKKINFKNHAREKGIGTIIGVCLEKNCLVVEIDKQSEFIGWNGVCLKKEVICYLENYSIKKENRYYYVKTYEILED
ncbi:MAG: hypothetical protein ACRCY7_03140 [Cetobacterium sp.]|uniref:hypothetical protein n=1 Tax=Cetobacterium sp. TaxID=2071632 RepID=UPI003F3526E2